VQNDSGKEAAESTISEAEDAIAKALAEGKNVTNAQNKLNEAKAAFADGDYGEAASLANWAVNFANSATVIPTPKPASQPTNTTQNPSPQPNPKFDFGILLLLVPIGLVLLLVAYLLMKKRKN
jgi:hypothetical protein